MIVKSSKSCGKSIYEITSNSNCLVIETEQQDSCSKNTRKSISLIELEPGANVLTRDMVK